MAKSVIDYHKLVRDKIPEMIESSGKQCKVLTLDHDTYISSLPHHRCDKVTED